MTTQQHSNWFMNESEFKLDDLVELSMAVSKNGKEVLLSVFPYRVRKYVDLKTVEENLYEAIEKRYEQSE